ncbi:uncharacterized protein I303_101260 [Kwoniella dejecticola CBS 10117]|uniref:Uncharacterized protein n=1 Tax=Kwoniella dejecticola CBS 10117 TaxID=1296121 RepID=A0A1A6AH89_9TREE|nr:uncharacterized protein I303_01267 [Kwoniella dejecticola CBS 10117]OBR89440.1 hypothetical protein I303_01267 [Kwoniella dejecticola CBS 10117]
MLATRTQPTGIHTHTHGNMSRMTPGWDEQIVPTLKKRLESESQYLTKRLSAASFEEDHTQSASSSSKLNAFPISPTFGVFQHTSNAGPSSIPTASRVRTRSGLGSNDTHIFSNGSGKQLVEDRRPKPRIDTSVATSSNSPKLVTPTNLPSRIPTRPRSKSQLSSIRPPPIHTRSNPPPLPSSGTGIPISKTRSRSPTKRTFSTNKMSAAVVEPQRGSLDLGGSRIKEGFIKNELPPFKMNPNEALRIAEKGHEIADAWDSNSPNRMSFDGANRLEERKRSISMKPNNTNLQVRRNNATEMERSGSSGSDGSSRRNSRPSTSSAVLRSNSNSRGYGISTSHTGLGLGMGQPSSSSRVSNSRNGQRTGSARSPANGSPASFNAPRSASLNLLSGSPSLSANGLPNGAPNSRLGVAAHFIPPESTYTPPKGTDWDDVVLPTVAKKLGINENDKKESDISAGEEDLAVEWDKDGTPIRWVKRKYMTKGGMGLGDSSSSQNSPRPNDTTPTRTHAFSPTFEPSPDNPLQPRARPSSSSLRNKPSSDGIEMGQIRTTSGLPSGLNNAYYPGSEPFPSSSSSSKNGMHRKTSSQNIASPLSANSNGGGGLSRKPSTLRKQAPTPSVSRQTSEMSLRNRTISNAGNRSNFGPPPGQAGQLGSTPGTTHRITDAIYENQMARREGRANEKPHKNDEGSHGKGCGCLIM